MRCRTLGKGKLQAPYADGHDAARGRCPNTADLCMGEGAWCDDAILGTAVLGPNGIAGFLVDFVSLRVSRWKTDRRAMGRPYRRRAAGVRTGRGWSRCAC